MNCRKYERSRLMEHELTRFKQVNGKSKQKQDYDGKIKPE